MGRPKKPEDERKLTRSVYVTSVVIRAIESRYGTLSKGLEGLAKVILKAQEAKK